MLMRTGAVRGERVKKVSVVISLDGPADLRIDASVREKRLGRTIWREDPPQAKEETVEKGEDKEMARRGKK